MFVLLIFNILGTLVYITEFFHRNIVEKQVTITDVYTLDSRYSQSYCAGFIDDNGQTGLIHTQKLQINDNVIVYQDLNSANANGSNPEWYLSKWNLYLGNILNLIIFILLTSLNIFFLIKRKRKFV